MTRGKAKLLRGSTITKSKFRACIESRKRGKDVGWLRKDIGKRFFR